jgi:sialidase-1
MSVSAASDNIRKASDLIRTVVVEKAGLDNPRNDTANVAELSGGELMIVWQKYAADNYPKCSDLCPSRIVTKRSRDGGLTWQDERMLVDVYPGDLNTMAPALCLLPSGELLMNCVRDHSKSSTTMLLFRSKDNGRTFAPSAPIWERSPKFWLQGGASSLCRLSSGRLLLPFESVEGELWTPTDHSVTRFFYSDDEGHHWNMGPATIALPMRGAMEPSVAELENSQLLVSLRTELGSIFLSRSNDNGETWSLPQTSGLKAPESGTCLRRIPGTRKVVLFWNDSLYDPKHHNGHFGERTPLSVALSGDGGETWRRLGNIATGPKQFTNLGCTFLSSGNAIVSFMVGDAVRKWADLCIALIDKRWFQANQ